jgi:predicted permease
VFLFVFGVSLCTGVLFGLLPAMRATRVDLAAVMKSESRSVAGSRGWLSRGLLVVQVALSLVLIVGAGLFLRTLQNLRSVDVGFNPNHVLMFSVNASLNGYDADRARVLFDDMRQRLQALPGVRSVALTRTALLSGSRSTSTTHVPGKAGTNIHMMFVSPEFFRTMEIPIVAGRGFSDRDTPTSPKVVVINEAAARTLFPDGPALSARLGFSPEKHTDFEVVGVIRDTKYASVRDAAPPTIYQALGQNPSRSSAFVLRTAGDPALMAEPVRRAIREIDPNLPLTGVATQAERVEQRFAQERLFATASSLFGGLGLLLAAIGLFGLMSYNVSRRSQELGIRMALGARRGSIIGMVLGESLLLVGVGVAIGLTAAYFLGRLIATQLYGLPPTDVVTIAVAIAVIVVVSTLAGYLPARRASRVDPMVVLNRG